MADTPTAATRPRRPPGRLELAALTFRLHARAIAWGAGLVAITLALAVPGILQTVVEGEPVERAGTIVSVPSSGSIHVGVRLEGGETVLVRRRSAVPLAQGDRVRVLETRSPLSTVGYRMAGEGDVVAPNAPSMERR